MAAAARAGGGGAQGGTQGLVEFGSGESNEWFGLGGSPGENATGSLSGLNAQYQFYSGDGANGSVTISYATGLPGAPTNVTPVRGGVDGGTQLERTERDRFERDL